MKFEIKVKCDDLYSGDLSITVSTDPNAAYLTLLPGKARLVAEALLQAAAAAETTGGAQAAIDALLASADKPVAPASDMNDLPL